MEDWGNHWYVRLFLYPNIIIKIHLIKLSVAYMLTSLSAQHINNPHISEKWMNFFAFVLIGSSMFENERLSFWHNCNNLFDINDTYHKFAWFFIESIHAFLIWAGLRQRKCHIYSFFIESEIFTRVINEIVSYATAQNDTLILNYLAFL